MRGLIHKGERTKRAFYRIAEVEIKRKSRRGSGQLRYIAELSRAWKPRRNTFAPSQLLSMPRSFNAIVTFIKAAQLTSDMMSKKYQGDWLKGNESTSIEHSSGSLAVKGRRHAKVVSRAFKNHFKI